MVDRVTTVPLTGIIEYFGDTHSRARSPVVKSLRALDPPLPALERGVRIRDASLKGEGMHRRAFVQPFMLMDRRNTSREATSKGAFPPPF